MLLDLGVFDANRLISGARASPNWSLWAKKLLRTTVADNAVGRPEQWMRVGEQHLAGPVDISPLVNQGYHGLS
jgi:hypothetical protein